MKIFVTQLPLVFKKIFLTQLLIFILLFSISLQAETRYLFPSDMIVQSKQATHETNHSYRYPAHVPTYVTQGSSLYNPAEINRYPVEVNTNQFNNRTYNQSIEIAPNPTPMETDEQYRHNTHSYLYVSDIEPDKRLTNQKAKAIQYSLQKTKEQNRSIPTSLFSPYQRNAPRMLQGVFTGIIPPRYGYPRPNYNYGGLNNMILNQSIPFTGYVIFPEQWNSPGTGSQ